MSYLSNLSRKNEILKKLITGKPGIGKTTVIKKLYKSLDGYCIKGFYTQEIKRAGKRVGFELCDFNNRSAILSHINIQSRSRVGRYGVDIPTFECFLDDIDFFDPQTELIILDEIGKMECFSARFIGIVQELFQGNKAVIATIALKGSGIISELKKMPDVRLIEITKKNRSHIPDELHDLVESFF